ncbi:MAG TPA: hypothetical protein VF796_16350 [Humisphaera sp.]
MAKKEIVRLALAGCVALAAAGCKQDKPAASNAPSAAPATKPADANAVAVVSGTGAPAGRLPADQQTTKPAAVAAKVEAPAVKVETPAAKVETPAVKVETPTAKVETPAVKPEAPSAKVETPPAKPETPAGPPVVSEVAPNVAGTAGPEAGSNALFTVPPSRGPVAHKFQQLTLLRSGPSGDLEMQLTGDGIYRIRDHGRGKSYSGDGKLEDAQIAEWATLLKDWETLKDSYLPTPAPTDVDKVEIIYGGKKVVAPGGGKENPKAFDAAYKKLLDLQAQSMKESEAPATPAGEKAAEKTETSKEK